MNIEWQIVAAECRAEDCRLTGMWLDAAIWVAIIRELRKEVK